MFEWLLMSLAFLFPNSPSSRHRTSDPLTHHSAKQEKGQHSGTVEMYNKLHPYVLTEY